MRRWPIALSAALLLALSGMSVRAFASQFVVFPKATELVSQDGRFVVRNINTEGPATNLGSTFHSLRLYEVATGRSRKLCDYLGVAAVAWSSNDRLVITQYVGKRTSRALVFSAITPDDAIMLDKTMLTRLVPTELRPALRENDHVFLEGSRVEQEMLYLTVWGYGAHDANGFRWHCPYNLQDGEVLCDEERGSHP
jgi:hypothetical protein